MLRILVVDDSPVARGLLIEILSGEPDFEVVGVAVNGLEAVAMVTKITMIKYRNSPSSV